LNAATRAVAINTTELAGNEITFLMDNGLGYQSWDYWDATAGLWVSAKAQVPGALDPVTVPGIATLVYAAFDKTNYRSASFHLTATKDEQYQSMIVMIGSNGVDVYSTTYAELGNATIIAIDTNMVGNLVELRTTTLASGVTVVAKKISEF
jgi:hypothetical protein